MDTEKVRSRLSARLERDERIANKSYKSNQIKQIKYNDNLDNKGQLSRFCKI